MEWKEINLLLRTELGQDRLLVNKARFWNIVGNFARVACDVGDLQGMAYLELRGCNATQCDNGANSRHHSG